MACSEGLPTHLGAFASRADAEVFAKRVNLDPPADYIRALYAPEGMQDVAYVCFGDWGKEPTYVGLFTDPGRVPNLPVRPEAVQFYEIRIGSGVRRPRPVTRIRIDEGAGTSEPVPVAPRVTEQPGLDLLGPVRTGPRFEPWRQVVRAFFARRLGVRPAVGLYGIIALLFLGSAIAFSLWHHRTPALVWDLERTMGQTSAAPWLHPAIVRARVYEGPGFRCFSAPLDRSRAVTIMSRLPTDLLDPDAESPAFFLPLPDYFGEASLRPDFMAQGDRAERLAGWRDRFFVNVREGMIWREGDEWLVYDFERERLLGRLRNDQPSPWTRWSNR